ncbi:thioredoxin domain-containing protein [Virgisporangium aurantiacum]|uniref:Spermatogenesis-associated protein 20-like TRX domain-containing protein n=1 Tax=Virgisporangium aurantiacum TaxID=175570 RepID=A0A8J3Z0J9_9ACTN|nr:thioredoxin domain-containing protein [Virgisporangium aurantiacum]GIJ53046.1 hypothetical protein Vau01_005620 [Virgisporangium aurantiacum]
MGNRLAGSASPYLEQHADNPVDWWPWSADAFAEARRRDVPVLISIGYAACHWCHVMAHESFEDEAVARIVNELTVPVKVDREERPDVDAVYMTATQAMTGHGGWPMTVFATPDGKPFFCGTYFPPQQFVQLVRAVDEAWTGQRAAVEQQGGAVAEAIARASAHGLPAEPLTSAALNAAAGSLKADFDPVNGGFGGAPKFPPHLALLFLLRHHQRTKDPQSLEMVRQTCERMARGGMYDQLAGGFARYSVDATWTVPHFEKMLYDNALLLRVYTHLWRLTGDPLALRIADETAAFIARDLGTADGGFASALDADTDGREGLTYVWTPRQLREITGDDHATEIFGVTDDGTFEHGTSVLQLATDPEDRERWLGVRERLLEARAARPQPARDDKVVAAWNGLAITALAEYVSISPEPRPRVGLAMFAAADALVERHLTEGGRLRRVSRDGRPGPHAGVLDDYGAVAEALCALHQVSGEGRWLASAKSVLDAAIAHFGTGDGGFYDTADDAEHLIARPADPTDNATPSGLSSVAAALVTYSALAGEPAYREVAERALATVAGLAGKHGRFMGYACAVGEALLSGPFGIAVATAEPQADPLVRAAWRLAPPGAVVVAGPPDAAGVPLLSKRSLRDGVSTAYVCRDFVCDAPVTTVEALAAALS